MGWGRKRLSGGLKNQHPSKREVALAFLVRIGFVFLN